jgi:hypothetical protein
MKSNLRKKIFPIRCILGWVCLFLGVPASIDYINFADYMAGRSPGPMYLIYRVDSNLELSFWLALGLFGIGLAFCYLDYRMLTRPRIIGSQMAGGEITLNDRFYKTVASNGMAVSFMQIVLFFVLPALNAMKHASGAFLHH